MKRPEYITCIQNTNMSKGVGYSICGRHVMMEFYFQSIDHAYHNNLNEGRLLPCPDCLKKVVETLTKHQDEIVKSYKNEK